MLGIVLSLRLVYTSQEFDYIKKLWPLILREFSSLFRIQGFKIKNHFYYPTFSVKRLYQILYGIGKPEMKYEKTESANAIYLTYRLSITVHGICATYNKILSYNNLSYFSHCPLQSPIVRKSNKTTDMCKTQKYSEILELYFICYRPFWSKSIQQNSCFSYFSEHPAACH